MYLSYMYIFLVDYINLFYISIYFIENLPWPFIFFIFFNMLT